MTPTLSKQLDFAYARSPARTQRLLGTDHRPPGPMRAEEKGLHRLTQDSRPLGRQSGHCSVSVQEGSEDWVAKAVLEVWLPTGHTTPQTLPERVPSAPT